MILAAVNGYEIAADQSGASMSTERDVIFIAGNNGVTVAMRPQVLDAIAEIHKRGEFPHQRKAADGKLVTP